LASNDNEQQRERRLIHIFAGISLVIHFFCMFVGVPRFFFPTNQIVPEEDWAIEADIISDIPVPPRKGPLPKEELRDKDAADDEAAPAPQLPDLAAKAKAEAKKDEPVPVKEEKPKPEPKKEEPPVPAEEEKPKPKPETKKEKEKPNSAKTVQDESYKNQLFDKLLRDQKQQVNKESKEKALDNKKRADLAKKIATLKKSLGTGAGGEGSAGAASYGQVLKKFVTENYRIPDAYNYEGAVAPVVSFSVSASGQMQGLKMVTSSGSKVLDHFVLQSMEDAAGFFPKPPADSVGQEITMRFSLP
jgi:TonB family protein